ncbi:MAG TPA: hypothetical protein VG013_17860 [Gemmataceae bacterium]|nr:hypothetical protein [Gemmataceae bacterium]
MANEFLQVDPRKLRLPPSPAQGADPIKLHRQIAKFGKSIAGIPPLWVHRGKDGELRIVDGVTRATRVAKLLPGTNVMVEVIEEHPSSDYSRGPTVADMLP